MADLILAAIILIIIGAAIRYIVKAKKSGVKCIGCPASSSCPSCNGGKNSDGCSCCSETHENSDS